MRECEEDAEANKQRQGEAATPRLSKTPKTKVTPVRCMYRFLREGALKPMTTFTR